VSIEDKPTNLTKNISRREIWSWAMFDFANSGYTTVVITTIFNTYFVSIVANNQDSSAFVWTATLAVSYAIIIITAQIIGIYADIYAAKKRLLLLSVIGCTFFTLLLYFVGPGDLWLAIFLVILANFFFGTGENLIAAFLPEIAKKDSLGKISGWGWSLGYIGGLISLGCSFIYIIWAKSQGHQSEQFVPITLLITASLFAISSLPTFLYLRERAQPQKLLYRYNIITEIFSRLIITIKTLHNFHDLSRFLICLIFYQAGIQTIVVIAAIYAQQVMGFDHNDTILLVILVNITAALGAFIFGNIQDKVGHIPTITLTLIGWIIMVLLAWGAEDRTMFWIAANIAGLCLGSSQSAGRALIGYLSPVLRRAEIFGLWGLAVKLSSIIGPLTYGLISWISQGDHRLAILITGNYFIIGLFILMSVNVQRGRQAALSKNQPCNTVSH
tara:strand:+ start:2773 stop:4101 length:1329 start_codon:yes stop_codon:yes gene_type:complete